jgi:DNA-binding response OmpR family regulator
MRAERMGKLLSIRSSVTGINTILLVDDHRGTLITLSLVLRNAGYRCVTASNHDEAVQAFRANLVDLVILDHGLPGISGTDLAAHLKTVRPVAILMLSGNPDLAGKPESVDILLPKPQEPEALLNTMAELLARQQLRPKKPRA